MRSVVRLLTLVRLGVIQSTQIETLANVEIAMLVAMLASVVLLLVSTVAAALASRGEYVLLIVSVSLGVLAILLAISAGVVSIRLSRVVTEYCVTNGVNLTLAL